MGVTAELSQFVARAALEDIPPACVDRAKLLLIDFVGATLAAPRNGTAELVVDHVRGMEAKQQAGVIGYGFKTVAPYAALANSTLNHVTELEAIGAQYINPSAVISVALTGADWLQLSGKALLEALILGVDTQGRISAATRGATYAKGNFFAFTYLGCAAAAAKLFGFDASKINLALGMAASQAGGLQVQEGTATHFLELGLPCRTGIEAAMLVANGARARLDIVEFPGGFGSVIVGADSCDFEQMTKDLGQRYVVLAPEIHVKKYPCCFANHMALDGFIDVMAEHNIPREEIARVDVGVNEYIARWLRHPDPKTGDEAKFSLQHTMATAMLNGRVWVDAFTDDFVRSDAARLARERINVVQRRDWAPERAAMRVRIDVELRNGRKYSKEVNRVHQLTAEDQLRRYRALAAQRLGPEAVERSLELMLNLEHQRDVRELMHMLVYC